MDISIGFAFAAGILSFFSPCVFPLLPAYITHLTGGTIHQKKLRVNKKLLLLKSLGFIAGFSLIFIIMGASASYLGQFFSEYRPLFEQLAGILIVIFGLQMLGLLQFKFLMMEKKISTPHEGKKMFGSILLGMAFASGWSPCVGLALSSILLLAGSSDTLNHGIMLLSVYSLGLAVPFLMISLVISHSLKVMKVINKQLKKLSIVNGVIMLMLGFLVFTGKMQVISGWLSAYSLFSF